MLPAVDARALLGEPLRDDSGEREIDVVAAEQDVLADRDAARATVRRPLSVTAIRVKSVVPPPISTTRIRSPTLDALAPVGMPLDPGIEGRLRLFEQRDVLVSGLFRRFERQLARDGVEGRGHGDQHLLRR